MYLPPPSPTENLPAGITAKTTGRIDTLLVHEKQEVQQGDLLAVIENTACLEDVMELKDALDRQGVAGQARNDGKEARNDGKEVRNDGKETRNDGKETRNDGKEARNDDSLSTFCLLPSARLGDLQPHYNAFIKALEDYQYFITTDYHHKKINVIKKQIHTQRAILQKTKQQLQLSQQQLSAAYQIFTIDSNLYDKKVLSKKKTFFASLNF